MRDSVIKIEGASKKYAKGLKDTMLYGMGDLARNFIGVSSSPGSLRKGEFWALKDISFEVKKGETVGIIGPNGSGKTTLLKLLTGIFLPDTGRIEVAGKVGALLEVGAGFHPMLTGRENIYVNGAILGMRKKEVDRKFASIVSFAGIGDFLDTPVKHYSSGMYVRLGFAVAVHSEPDILLVDEVLAVGDAKFQARCFRKLKEFRDEGRTILFVTHSTEQVVRHCDRAVLISNGMKYMEGEPKEVTNQYLDLLFGIEEDSHREKTEDRVKGAGPLAGAGGGAPTERIIENPDLLKFLTQASPLNGFSERKSYNRNEYRWGDRRAEIIDYLVLSGGRTDPVRCYQGEGLDVYVKVMFLKDIEHPIYGIAVKSPDGVLVYGNNSRDWGKGYSLGPRKSGEVHIVRFSLEPRLNAGHYLISLGVAEDTGAGEVPLDRRYDAVDLLFESENLCYGLVDMGLRFESLNVFRFPL